MCSKDTMSTIFSSFGRTRLALGPTITLNCPTFSGKFWSGSPVNLGTPRISAAVTVTVATSRYNGGDTASRYEEDSNEGLGSVTEGSDNETGLRVDANESFISHASCSGGVPTSFICAAEEDSSSAMDNLDNARPVVTLRVPSLASVGAVRSRPTATVVLTDVDEVLSSQLSLPP